MHGRPRTKGPQDPERVKAAKQKATLFGQLLKEVLERRQAKIYDRESLDLSAKLLELNPEVYTVWNYRREALLPVLMSGGTEAVAAAEGELALIEKALYRNPKSYSTWHHRKWVVVRRFTSLEHELKLVGMLLDADERNFHGWRYRRFVVELMGTPAERALEFARKKIDQNFSNYSAWHSRTVLLPIAHAPQPEGSVDYSRREGQGEVAETADGNLQMGGGGGSTSSVECRQPVSLVPKEVLDEEYELVKQAFYTEPEDQSGWFYHRWLMGSSWAHWDRARGGEEESTERQALLTVVTREQEMCQDLLEIEPDSKWPLLTMARLKEMQIQLLSAGSAPKAQQHQLKNEVREIYAKLGDVDPMRAGYYHDAAAGRASVVMASAVVQAR